MVFSNLPRGIYPVQGKLEATFLSYFQMIPHSVPAHLGFLG